MELSSSKENKHQNGEFKFWSFCAIHPQCLSLISNLKMKMFLILANTGNLLSLGVHNPCKVIGTQFSPLSFFLCVSEQNLMCWKDFVVYTLGDTK